jgi:hypothetical protein
LSEAVCAAQRHECACFYKHPQKTKVALSVFVLTASSALPAGASHVEPSASNELTRWLIGKDLSMGRR